MHNTEQTVQELEVQARESVTALMARCENNGDCSTCPMHGVQSIKCRDCRDSRQAAALLSALLDKLTYHPLITLDELNQMRHEDDLYIEYLNGGYGRWEQFGSVVDTRHHGRQLTLIGAAALPINGYGASWLPYRRKPGRLQD